MGLLILARPPSLQEVLHRLIEPSLNGDDVPHSLAHRFGILALLNATAILALSGCAGGDKPDAEGEPPVTNTITVVNPKTWALPLDAYIPSPDQSTTLFVARIRLTMNCMRRFGFDYPDPKPIVNVLGTNEKRYGINDAKRAAAYGYRDPDLQAVQDAVVQPSYTPEALAVLTGENAEAGEGVPAGGCDGEAKAKLQEGAPQVDQMFVYSLMQASWDKSGSDSRVKKVASEWSSCMKQRGFSYGDPMAANNDKLMATGDIASDREIAIAIADVACKDKVRYMSIRASVEGAYQERSIAEHSNEMDALKKNLETQLQNAARVSATGGA